MNLKIKNIKETDCTCDVLILLFTEGNPVQYKHLSPSLTKLIKRIFSKEFCGKQNEVLLVPAPEDIKPERILFVGLGKKNDVTREKVRQAGGKSAVYLKDKGIRKIGLSTQILASLKLSPVDFAEGSFMGLYAFRKYLNGKGKKTIDSITVLSEGSEGFQKKLNEVKTITSAVSFAKDLVNTPANDMTPSHLAEVARSLRKRKISVKVIEKRAIRKLGMGSYLSVAKGSNQPPKFIILHYHGAKNPPVVLIGKSITFDSGGLSLKPADGMEKMKYDMAGGAAVLGVIKAVSELTLPVNLIAILPATENLIGGSATRPGDVVQAIDGKTIEIISTDAEGRMTLADAIGYAKRFKPGLIVDIATLTGACSIALGNVTIAMMGNDRDVMKKLVESGNNTYERVWEMPLFEEYKESIKSDIADFKNTGGRTGSLISSAYFLSEFAGKTPWVHLDIAGTAWSDKDKPYTPKGASGVGVRLLFDLINNLK